jgi:hypothetical protein
MQFNKPYDNRMGRFRISLETIERYPDRVRELLAQCIIIRAEIRWEWEAVEYTAFCPQFEVTQMGHEPRRYDVIATFSAPGGGAEIMPRQPFDFYRRFNNRDGTEWTGVLRAWERVI